MKQFIGVCLVVFGLFSCGDDDKPYVPELNKLTHVSCSKNGQAYFDAEITYDQDEQINRIVLNQGGSQYTDSYIWIDRSVSVSGVKIEQGELTTPFVHTVYTLKGDLIVSKEEMGVNKYMGNSVFTEVQSHFLYRTNWLNSATKQIQRPKEDGSGYRMIDLGEVDRYQWKDGNVVYYDFLPQQEMVYEYANQLRPANFPFRVINSLRPIDFDMISPINLLYGKMNRELPVRAHWYYISGNSEVCAEYVFQYTLTGDYITGMSIDETIHPLHGAVAETNRYEYTFVYNFVTEQP